MFIKLVAKSTQSNNAAAWKAWTETIRDILDGSITSTSGLSTTYFETGSCQIIGSKPTTNAGADTFSAFSVASNISSSSENYVNFNFNHAESTGSYGYHQTIHLNVTATGTYGLRFRAGDGNNANLAPYNSTSYYAVSTSTNDFYDPVFSQETTLIWANKHCFVIQQNNSVYMTSQGTFGYDATAANEYMYDTIGSAKHGPFISMGSYMGGSRWNSPLADNATYDRFWVLGQSFLVPSGAEITTLSIDNNYNLGWSRSDNTYYQSLYPTPYKNIFPLRTSTGHLHQLLPVYLDPHHNRIDASYPFNARLKTLYRTSDDISSPGSLITHDGVQYAVWIPYKTGSSSGDTDNIQNQCYLIPTTVGGA